jgi:pimeloyl-ACP methyl ester carboxylesterase
MMMTDWTMKRARGDGIEIQVASREGRGKHVFCLHGLTANCRCWDVMAKSLTPAHAMTAMDFRGRGLSDKPSSGYSWQQHVGDLYCVLEDLGLEKVALLGHSLGAYVALAFAAKYPDRVEKLILMDGGGDLPQEQWDKINLVIKPSLDRLGQVFPSFAAYIQNMKQAPILQPWSQAIEDYFRYESEDVEGGVRSRIHPEHIEEEIRNIYKETPSAYYPKVKCPVLLVRATDGILSRDDLVVPLQAAERMLREIPDARCVDIQGTNHYSILLQPNQERDREILIFLEESSA